MRHLTLIVIFNLALVACCNGNKCDDAGEGYKHLRDMCFYMKDSLGRTAIEEGVYICDFERIEKIFSLDFDNDKVEISRVHLPDSKGHFNTIDARIESLLKSANYKNILIEINSNDNVLLFVIDQFGRVRSFIRSNYGALENISCETCSRKNDRWKNPKKLNFLETLHNSKFITTKSLKLDGLSYRVFLETFGAPDNLTLTISGNPVFKYDYYRDCEADDGYSITRSDVYMKILAQWKQLSNLPLPSLEVCFDIGNNGIQSVKGYNYDL